MCLWSIHLMMKHLWDSLTLCSRITITGPGGACSERLGITVDSAAEWFAFCSVLYPFQKVLKLSILSIWALKHNTHPPVSCLELPQKLGCVFSVTSQTFITKTFLVLEMGFISPLRTIIIRIIKRRGNKRYLSSCHIKEVGSVQHKNMAVVSASRS